MKTIDIMTKDVVTATTDTPVRDIARLMTEKHISGIPVVDPNGRLVGIVSHSDLLHRPETGTEPRRRRLVEIFADPDKLARDYTKTHGMKAGDVMSRNVVWVDVNSDLRDAADVLDKRNVKRVPVMQEGRVVGILSRGDVVRAFAMQPPSRASGTVDDAAIESAIRQRFSEQSWLDAGFVTVTIKNGVVELSGLIRSESQRKAAQVLVEEVAGVAGVDNNLRLRNIATMGI